MYGGHITDDWDRITNNTYLRVLIKPELLSGMPLASLVPVFRSPDPHKHNYDQYVNYVDEKLPAESPLMFGLHPNAEIGYLTTQGETLFGTILDVQGGSGGGGGAKEEGVTAIINDFLTKIPEQFNIMEIQGKLSEGKGKEREKTPEVIVCFQECERMNGLLFEIKRSLKELELGLQGALNISEAMEKL